jgi:L,D-peptidoglycan transpeptidase YkuD (ErfK/YbiS/YcfS/YnhG family)
MKFALPQFSPCRRSSITPTRVGGGRTPTPTPQSPLTSSHQSRLASTVSLLILVQFVAATVGTAEDHLAASVAQLIVGVAPSWDSMRGKLQRFDKTTKGWEAGGPAVPVLFGKNGLAWGRGELVGNGNAPVKVERDNRAPAGVFQIGTIYTYDKALPPGANYPFHTVGAGDAWVDDLTDPNYNRHVLVDPAHPPSWFEKNKMRRGDFAYRWLVEIRHNTDPPVPGYGSAIFFHIRRGPLRPSAGCTTLAESDLVQLIRWLRIDAHPRYVCLPKPEYLARWNLWGLPDPRLTDLF